MTGTPSARAPFSAAAVEDMKPCAASGGTPVLPISIPEARTQRLRMTTANVKIALWERRRPILDGYGHSADSVNDGGAYRQGGAIGGEETQKYAPNNSPTTMPEILWYLEIRMVDPE